MHNFNTFTYGITVLLSNHGSYETDGKTVEIPAPAPSIFCSGTAAHEQPLLKEKSEIKFADKDCLTAARELVEAGEDVAVLNMASFNKPGGGVWRGCRAQEESIFRRTNAFLTLNAFKRHVGSNEKPLYRSSHKYPLGYYDSIYSPSITVFRDEARKQYELLDKPFQVSLITCAAIKDPKTIVVNGEERLNQRDEAIMREKVRTILNEAMVNGNTSVVLGAFGCGAFNNPPKHVAELFRESLEGEFHNCFNHVVFAIISRDPQNPNLKTFKEVFGVSEGESSIYSYCDPFDPFCSFNDDIIWDDMGDLPSDEKTN